MARMESSDFFSLIFGAALVDNFVLAKFLGLCPFLGATRRSATAMGLGVSTAFVLTLASAESFLVSTYILTPFDLGYLQTMVFIVLIAGTVQLIELFLRAFNPWAYRVLGVYLPLITTNCAVLGVALLNRQLQQGFAASLIYGFGAALGFTLVLLLFADLRERLVELDIPESFRGAPIALVTAGVMAMAFAGFAGMFRG